MQANPKSSTSVITSEIKASNLTPEAVQAQAELAKFIVDRATRTAVEVVSTCAADGCQRWRLFFAQGLADAISEDTELEADFFQRLCGGRGLPYSAEIIEKYFVDMPEDRLKKFMDPTSLKRKAHPANLAFYGASFINKSGEYFMDIFKVFVKYGLVGEKVDIVANRCFDELERACNLGNEAFMITIIPMLTHLPEELTQKIVSRSAQAEVVIDLLVNKCHVPISVFMEPKILISAKPAVAEYIVAIDARSRREPEREIVFADDER